MCASLHADWIGSASACCRDNRPPTPSWPCADASTKPLHSLTLLSPFRPRQRYTESCHCGDARHGLPNRPASRLCALAALFLHSLSRQMKGKYEHRNMNMCSAHQMFFLFFFFLRYSHRAPDIPNLLSLEAVWVCVHVCASLCWLVEFGINPSRSFCYICDMPGSCRSLVPRNLEKMANLRTSWFNFQSGWKPTQREASLLQHLSVRKVHFLKN